MENNFYITIETKKKNIYSQYVHNQNKISYLDHK